MERKDELTAITDPEGIAVKHFLDSLLLLKACPLPEGASLIDVGTGAGFPSVPVAAARPDIRLTLLDSLQKRIRFLETVCGSLSIPAQCVHARAEEAGRMDEYRERFDCASARAVARCGSSANTACPCEGGRMFCRLKGRRYRGGAGRGKIRGQTAGPARSNRSRSSTSPAASAVRSSSSAR